MPSTLLPGWWLVIDPPFKNVERLLATHVQSGRPIAGYGRLEAVSPQTIAQWFGLAGSTVDNQNAHHSGQWG